MFPFWEGAWEIFIVILFPHGLSNIMSIILEDFSKLSFKTFEYIKNLLYTSLQTVLLKKKGAKYRRVLAVVTAVLRNPVLPSAVFLIHTFLTCY